MKASVTEYIIAVFELFEAEVTSFKKGILNFFIAIAVLIIALFLLFIAFIFVAMGIYEFYATMMQAYQASFATAGSFIAIALLLFGWLKWRQ